MFKGFSKIWIISIIVTLIIVGFGGVFIYWLVFKVIKAEIPCSPPYFTECKTDLDCLRQTKCEAGEGIICFPQCKYEGYDLQCLRGKCIWCKDNLCPSFRKMNLVKKPVNTEAELCSKVILILIIKINALHEVWNA